MKGDLNSLPNDKVSDVTKLKAFADEKSNVAKMTISLFDREENSVGKGGKADYQPSSSGLLKVGIVRYRVKACFCRSMAHLKDNQEQIYNSHIS